MSKSKKTPAQTAAKTTYRQFLQQVLTWAKDCVALIRFKKAWEKGQVPKEEMAARALPEEDDGKLVEEIFNAKTDGHSPSFEIQAESTRQLVEEIENAKPAWPEAQIQVYTADEASTEEESAETEEPTPEPEVVEEEVDEAGLIESSAAMESLTAVDPASDTKADKGVEIEAAFLPDRPTLLVIDDYAPLRRMMMKALHGANYNVCGAKDGVEGIVRVHENDVDLVITDVQMPRLDGFEMSKMLNVRDSTRHIPIVFLTDVLDDQTKAVARQLGAADTLIKPFTMDALFESIRAVLASHQPIGTEETAVST